MPGAANVTLELTEFPDAGGEAKLPRNRSAYFRALRLALFLWARRHRYHAWHAHFAHHFGAVAALYFIENIAYSFKLKKIAFLDVSMIALHFGVWLVLPCLAFPAWQVAASGAFAPAVREGREQVAGHAEHVRQRHDREEALVRSEREDVDERARWRRPLLVLPLRRPGHRAGD
mgnify:CR=1 FL=1